MVIRFFSKGKSAKFVTVEHFKNGGV